MTTESAAGRRLGVMFDRDRAPEDLAAFARSVEAAGADDVWVVEDLGWAGSIASAAIALAATSRVRVGIGIAPAPLRNPALLAMEIAALARMFPGRLVAGLGHGVSAWMRQVGAATPHQLALLGETVTAVRALLRGETVTLDGTVVHLDGVRLVHPPAEPPPVVTGVVGPRSLRLSGRLADGTVIAEGHGPAAVQRSLSLIAEGLSLIAEGRALTTDGRAPVDRAVPGHEAIVFTYLGLDDAPPAAAAALAEVVAGQADWLGVAPSDVFLAGGTAETAAGSVRALWEAGADTVVLRSIGGDPVDPLRRVITALGRGR